MASRPGLPTSPPSSGLQAPSTPPLLSGAAPGVSYLPADSGHPFLRCISRAAPCVISYCASRAWVPLSTPRFCPLTSLQGPFPPPPVLLGMGTPFSLPCSPGNTTAAGSLSFPLDTSLLLLFPRGHPGISGQITHLPFTPTTTGTLRPSRHLVVAASSLPPSEGRWGLPPSLPPPKAEDSPGTRLWRGGCTWHRGAEGKGWLRGASSW